LIWTVQQLLLGKQLQHELHIKKWLLSLRKGRKGKNFRLHYLKRSVLLNTCPRRCRKLDPMFVCAPYWVPLPVSVEILSRDINSIISSPLHFKWQEPNSVDGAILLQFATFSLYYHRQYCQLLASHHECLY